MSNPQSAPASFAGDIFKAGGSGKGGRFHDETESPSGKSQISEFDSAGVEAGGVETGEIGSFLSQR